MFNLNFFNKFKQKEEEKKDIKNIQNNDHLYVELSQTYIAYRLNQDEKINFVQLGTMQHDDYDSLLKLWNEALSVIISTLKIQVTISLFIKSFHFVMKNSNKQMDMDNARIYFANQLALSKENIEVKNIFNNSYFIVEYKFLQKILFAFKDYKIDNIYDTSLLHSSYIKTNTNHFYIDISFDSFDMILNHSKIQKRNIDINLNTLINRCAKSSYVDYETSYENIKLSFKNIVSYDDLSQSTKALEKIFLAYIDEIIVNIHNSLEYFSIKDNMDYIDTIYINGDVLELDFIIKILEDKLKIKFISMNKYLKINNLYKSTLTMYNNIDISILNKFDIDFEGLNYNDGRDEYVFIENKFIDKGSLTSSQKTKVDTHKKEILIKNNDSEVFNKPILKMSMSELFEFFQSKFLNNNSSSSINNTNIIYLIGIIPLGLMGFYTFNIISDTQRNFNNNIKILEDRIQRVDQVKKTLLLKNKQINTQRMSAKVDKIFWTEKFITISNLMPNEIWLSSLSLENIKKVIEDKEVVTQTMVLESRALPSNIGHISTIAVYMDKLLNAKENFKKDFSNINFGGADISNEYGYDVVNFSLVFHFEKNINITNVQEQENKVEKKSIGENLINIKQNSINQKDILDKL
jgi:hypothetical protein